MNLNRRTYDIRLVTPAFLAVAPVLDQHAHIGKSVVWRTGWHEARPS